MTELLPLHVDIPTDLARVIGEDVHVPLRNAQAEGTDLIDRVLALPDVRRDWTPGNEGVLVPGTQREAVMAMVLDQLERQRRALVDSGRTPTGEVTTAEDRNPAVRGRSAAETWAQEVGSVRQLPDGRRAVVVDRRLGYRSRADVADQGWLGSPHWYAQYRLAVVATTLAERAEDRAHEERAQDAEALRELRYGLADLMRSRPDRSEPRGVADPVGTIRYSTWVRRDGKPEPFGTAVLGRDGTLVWQDVHRGGPSEVVVTDRELVDSARELVARGPRTRAFRVQHMIRAEVITEQVGAVASGG